MRLFREAWDRFAADEGRLQDMIAAKADATARAKRWGGSE
jgi:hypothetical protein